MSPSPSTSAANTELAPSAVVEIAFGPPNTPLAIAGGFAGTTYLVANILVRREYLRTLIEQLRASLDAWLRGDGFVGGYVEGLDEEPAPEPFTSPYDCVSTIIVRPASN